MNYKEALRLRIKAEKAEEERVDSDLEKMFINESPLKITMNKDIKDQIIEILFNLTTPESKFNDFNDAVNKILELFKEQRQDIIKKIETELKEAMEYLGDGQLGDPNGAKCYQAHKRIENILTLLKQ